MKMSYEDRKKWILDHKDEYIKSSLASLEPMKEKIIKVWEREIGKKYTLELEKKWIEINGNVYKTIDERMKELQDKNKDINYHLNKKIMYDQENECKEEIDGISLKSVLNNIRYNHDKEIGVFLFINKEKIVDRYICDGDAMQVYVSNQDLANVLNKARELETGVCFLHNHPRCFAANPSKKDLKVFKHYKEMFNKFAVELIDCGIVTEWDYYSAKEKQDL